MSQPVTNGRIYSRIAGTGSCLPDKVVTNDDLSKIVDTSDEWIRTRTGIRERRIAGEGETSATLGHQAALRALEAAGVAPSELDMIVVGTTTPDLVFPSTACLIQAKLGAEGCTALDVNAACSGFIFALSVADKFIRTGDARTVLVVGAETLTRITDWSDRTTCVLFGDGAGALVLEAVEAGEDGRGILTTHLRSDGRHKNKLYVDGGVSSTKSVGYLRMEGREVFRYAVGMITDVIEDAFEATGETAETIDWFVPHQANRRIIDASAVKLGIAPEKVVITVDRHGNTSAASIPLALAAARADGRIKTGDLVLLEAMGGGFTWGSALIRW